MLPRAPHVQAWTLREACKCKVHQILICACVHFACGASKTPQEICNNNFSYGMSCRLDICDTFHIKSWLYFRVSAQILLQSHVCVAHNFVPRPSQPVTYGMQKWRGKISLLAMLSGRHIEGQWTVKNLEMLGTFRHWSMQSSWTVMVRHRPVCFTICLPGHYHIWQNLPGLPLYICMLKATKHWRFWKPENEARLCTAGR